MGKIFGNDRTRKLLPILAVSFLVTLNTSISVQAFPNTSWSTPPFPTGERLEVIRDHACSDEERAGEQHLGKNVHFQGNVISAEVFLSGYHMNYTREGHDHEVKELRVDVELQPPDPNPDTHQQSPRAVKVWLTYNLQDEDTSDDDDFYQTCIGFTVFALTRP